MISTNDFVHDQDSALTKKIFAETPFKTWLDRLHENNLDEVCDYVVGASLPKISQGALAHMRDLACQKFNVKPFVLYRTRDYNPQLSCIGYHAPAVLVPDSIVDADEEILQARLYAQAAAIAAGHHKLKFFIWATENIGGSLALPVIGQTMTLILYEWNRVRQFSLDRAVFLATGDFSLALKNILFGVVPDETLKNFTFGTDADTFLEQTRRYYRHDDPTQIVSEAFGYFSDYSWLPRRYMELRKFHAGRRLQ